MEQFRDKRKTNELTWDDYVQGVRTFRAEMSAQNMTMNDDMYCYTLLSGANLTRAMRVNVRGIARNTNVDRKITVEGLEDAILQMKSDELTTKAEFNECSENKDDQSTRTRRRCQLDQKHIKRQRWQRKIQKQAVVEQFTQKEDMLYL